MQKFLAFILYFFVKCLKFTYRYQIVGRENLMQAMAMTPSGAFAYALWHEQLIAGILGHDGSKVTPIVSQSKDGDLVNFTLIRMGYHPVRGSSHRGGTKALLELKEHANKGFCPALTMDGPKGPRRQVKMGIIEISRATGIPILPLISESSPKFIFHKSWDKHQLPLPFSKIKLCYGAPLLVPKNLTREEFKKYAQQLAGTMQRLQEQALIEIKK